MGGAQGSAVNWEAAMLWEGKGEVGGERSAEGGVDARLASPRLCVRMHARLSSPYGNTALQPLRSTPCGITAPLQRRAHTRMHSTLLCLQHQAPASRWAHAPRPDA